MKSEGICYSCGAFVTHNYKGELVFEKNKVDSNALKKANRLTKAIKYSIIGIIITTVLIITVVNVKNSRINGQERNIATEAMKLGYTNVYADVISIDPIYQIYQYRTTKTGKKIGNEQLKSIVCKCLTIENKEIWVSIPIDKYPLGKNGYETLTFSTPLHMVGRMEKAKYIEEELEDKLGEELVFELKNNIK